MDFEVPPPPKDPLSIMPPKMGQGLLQLLALSRRNSCIEYVLNQKGPCFKRDLMFDLQS